MIWCRLLACGGVSDIVFGLEPGAERASLRTLRSSFSHGVRCRPKAVGQPFSKVDAAKSGGQLTHLSVARDMRRKQL